VVGREHTAAVAAPAANTHESETTAESAAAAAV